MSAKDEFVRVFNGNIHREGADALLRWLESTDFFTAPASTKYHSCHEGGLVEHSSNVYKRLHRVFFGENSIEHGNEATEKRIHRHLRPAP